MAAAGEPVGVTIWSPRYAMLDGWRIASAIGIIFAHLIGKPLFGFGQVCVLVFFVLSGYCITASAESCRRSGLGPAGYMVRRIRRIYPPYFFALLLFIVTRLVKIRAGGEDQLPDTLAPWLQNFTLTQWLTLLRWPETFAYLNPTLWVTAFWTLNYEEQFYIVMGLAMYASAHFGRNLLWSVAGLMAASVAWSLFHPSITYGFFLEYWVSFGAGSLAYFRLCGAGDPRLRRVLEVALWLLLLVATALTLSVQFVGRSAYFEWMIASGFALLVIYLRPLDDLYRKSLVGVVLGALSLGSYSLYLTHQMNLTASKVVASALIRLGAPEASELILRALYMGAFAAVFWVFCERPFMNRRLPAAGTAVAA